MVKYSYGPYNKFNDEEQWIRITEGCPNNCPYCYEPQEFKIFKIPEIVRNNVKIMDMNLLCKPGAWGILDSLGKRKVNNKIVYYELVCGIDYRFLTPQLAHFLKQGHFKNIRLAWDFWYKDQYKIGMAVNMLFKAGYTHKDITIFMICNWKIPQTDCLKKMDLCKVWRVKVADCYFDNQVSPNIKPIWWQEHEIKEFRRKTRKHNQLVRFGIDPEIKKTDELQKLLLF
ncbi:hypothetical protein LCGC14_2080910 [marine sediment metagenome]|uniref:Radical SAM core domain-containing protein n=1 Tax=marine sediment metagenome TaxID=412755 RepID=A0A0F9GU04_9ZZZZ